MVSIAAVTLMTLGCNEGFFDGFDFDNFGPGMVQHPMDVGPLTQAEVPPPPVQGGTLALSQDERYAIASDQDRNAIFIVELETQTVRTVTLNLNDEPGRVAIDAHGKAHVVLRRGGAVVTVDIESAALERRDAWCKAPSGIAYDENQDLLHVACSGGQLISYDAQSGQISNKMLVEPDLRDVVISGGDIYLTLFRSASVLRYGPDYTLQERLQARSTQAMREDNRGFLSDHQFSPSVAWRAIPDPNGGITVTHQRGQDTEIVLSRPGGYGSSSSTNTTKHDDPCEGSIVQSTLSTFGPGYTGTAQGHIPNAILPVDVAHLNKEDGYVVVSVGTSMNRALPTRRKASIHYVDRDRPSIPGRTDCLSDNEPWTLDDDVFHDDDQPVAVAVTRQDTLIVQSREPAVLMVIPSWPRNISQPHPTPMRITLSTESRHDTGHALFHADTGNGIACASCHPGGQDDARVWDFEGIGPRRTQNFRGGLFGTEPFHWDGDMANFDMLVSHVFVERMGAQHPTHQEVQYFAEYLDRLPALEHDPFVLEVDTAAIERGKALFNSDAVKCANCHVGPLLTNAKSEDVGTGGRFQVPGLKGIATRAPFMHTGCAPTLHARFVDTYCGGGDQHGKTSHLTPSEIDDLVSYLETL